MRLCPRAQLVPGVPSLTLGFDVVPEGVTPTVTVEKAEPEAETTETEDEKVKRLEAAEENKPLKFLPDGVKDVLDTGKRSMKAAKDGFAECRAAADPDKGRTKDGPCKQTTASLTVNTVPFEITTKIGPVRSMAHLPRAPPHRDVIPSSRPETGQLQVHAVRREDDHVRRRGARLEARKEEAQKGLVAFLEEGEEGPVRRDRDGAYRSHRMGQSREVG